ncbi:MAG TPA: hypothetical protein VJX74_01635 [Blastocatellia bacterium]|nr:hypothetical protein [Blastocatellia bacterium]
MSHFRILLCALVLATGIVAAGSKVSAWQSSSVKTVQISPAIAEGEVGQQLKFTAVGKDESGKPLDMKPAAWFAFPSDVASADQSGTVTFYDAGQVMVGVVIGGKTEFVEIKVKPSTIARVEIETPSTPVVVVGRDLGHRAGPARAQRAAVRRG